MRNDILEKKDDIIKFINQHEPKSIICKFLKCNPETLNSYLKKLNINYSGNKGMKGKKTDLKRKSALEYLKKEFLNNPKLRKKLIEDGIKKNECELCGLNNWLGQNLTLELHHKDGNHYNNELNNLQILCPNCHSLTPNHSGKKYKSIKKIKIKTENKCLQCDVLINKKSKICKNCHWNNLRKVDRPDVTILINDVNNLGYVQTGKKYNVSDNTIRKWIKFGSLAK